MLQWLCSRSNTRGCDVFGYVYMRWTGPRSKGLHRHLRYGYAHVANYWHRRILPIHFTKRGGQRYRYEKRQGEHGSGKRVKGSYTEEKRKRYGHDIPLVLTGLARALSRLRNIRATGKGARVSISVGKMLLNPKKRREREREVTAVTPGERRDMARLFKKIMTARLNADRTTTIERIG